MQPLMITVISARKQPQVGVVLVVEAADATDNPIIESARTPRFGHRNSGLARREWWCR
jgi:hypothetical protein